MELLVSKNYMAPTFFTGLAMLLATFFPQLELDAINTTVNTLVVVAGALFVMYRQWATKRATVIGTRPEGFDK